MRTRNGRELMIVLSVAFTGLLLVSVVAFAPWYSTAVVLAR
jgi:hypothetical protein